MNEKMKLIPDLRFPEFKEDGEWRERKFGQVGEFVGGGTPSTSNAAYWNGNIQWYTPTEIKNGVLKPSIRTITEEGLRNSSAKLLPEGTILITTRATIGDAAIAIEKCTTNQGFQSLLVKESENNQFWYYWVLHHKYELESRSSGSTFKEIGKSEIKKIPTLSPKKAEQQKIASCLSSLDELIAAHNEKLDALKDHKKGLLQNLFPQEGETVPKVRFPEFEGDGQWVEKKLGEEIELLSGYAFKSQYFSEKGYKLITPKNFTKEGIATFNIENTKYTTEAADDKYLCKEGDLLVLLTDLTSTCELLGKPVLLNKQDGEVLLNQRIIKIIPIGKILLKFLLQFFLTDVYHNRIKSTATGTTVRHSSNKIILDTKILHPIIIEEQEKIASCLSAVDELISAQQEKIDQLQQHKKGLMQGLFPTPSAITN